MVMAPGLWGWLQDCGDGCCFPANSGQLLWSCPSCLSILSVHPVCPYCPWMWLSWELTASGTCANLGCHLCHQDALSVTQTFLTGMGSLEEPCFPKVILGLSFATSHPFPGSGCSLGRMDEVFPVLQTQLGCAGTTGHCA